MTLTDEEDDEDEEDEKDEADEEDEKDKEDEEVDGEDGSTRRAMRAWKTKLAIGAMHFWLGEQQRRGGACSDMLPSAANSDTALPPLAPILGHLYIPRALHASFASSPTPHPTVSAFLSRWSDASGRRANVISCPRSPASRTRRLLFDECLNHARSLTLFPPSFPTRESRDGRGRSHDRSARDPRSAEWLRAYEAGVATGTSTDVSATSALSSHASHREPRALASILQIKSVHAAICEPCLSLHERRPDGMVPTFHRMFQPRAIASQGWRTYSRAEQPCPSSCHLSRAATKHIDPRIDR